jgi:hypothetical protein
VTKTDHKSLCCLNDQVVTLCSKRRKWLNLLACNTSFNTTKGCDNNLAYSLSRVGHKFVVQAISVLQPLWLQEILNFYLVDTEAQQLL